MNSQPAAAMESGEPESSTTAGSKNARKKKKKNKNEANADVPLATDGVSQVEDGLQNVPVVFAEAAVEKLGELDEEDIENDFIQVTQELPVSKIDAAIVRDVAKKFPSESELEKALKTALDAEYVKFQVLQEQCGKERHQNEYLKQALDRMGVQIQEKDAKGVQLERSLEQRSHDLKSLSAQLKDSASVTQKLRDENHALKDALTKAQQHAVDESQKVELQQRVRVMDDALKQSAVQLNSIDNARKDLEVREKRHLERIMIIERELQASKSELLEGRQSAEQRCQVMSADLQRLTLELAQVEKMRTRYLELEKQKTDLDRVLQTLETQNKELINYGRTKDAELQHLQSETMEISRMNETFQRRSRELEARASERDVLASQTDSLRQQLCQKDTELQVLLQKEAELHGLHQRLAAFSEREAEFTHREAELKVLKQKEAEFAVLEAELHEFRQKVVTFAQKETASLQKEAELTQKEAEFLRKEAEFFQKEADVTQKEVEFLQRESSLARRLQELESLDSNRSNFKELEDELSSCRTEIQRLGANEGDLTREADRLKQELSIIQNQNENSDELKFKLSKDVDQLRWDSDVKENKISQLEKEKQDLKDRVSELQTSLSERDINAENFAQVQTDLNQRLEKTLLMQQELDKQKKENTVLHDEIEQTKSELLQRLADNDSQLRRELEEKDKEIEMLKRRTAELNCDGQEKMFNEIVHTQDNSAQQDKQETQSDAQISPEAGNDI